MDSAPPDTTSPDPQVTASPASTRQSSVIPQSNHDSSIRDTMSSAASGLETTNPGDKKHTPNDATSERGTSPVKEANGQEDPRGDDEVLAAFNELEQHLRGYRPGDDIGDTSDSDDEVPIITASGVVAPVPRSMLLRGKRDFKTSTDRITKIRNRLAMRLMGYHRNRKYTRQGPSKLIEMMSSLTEYVVDLDTRLELLNPPRGIMRPPTKKKETVDLNSEGDSGVKIAIKFYDSKDGLDEYGHYKDVHGEVEEGTYMCEKKPDYLIRVLCTRLGNEAQGAVDDLNALGQPDPDGIDILTFAVTSRHVCEFFRNIFGGSIMAENQDLIRFGKPFRAVIRNHCRLKSHLENLELEYSKSIPDQPCDSNTAASQSPGKQLGDSTITTTTSLPNISHRDGGDKGVGDSSNIPLAIIHFRLLLSFIDKYLGKQIQLFGRVRDGKEETVYFKDLWMVFDTGDTIYSLRREEEPKTFRNYAVYEEHKQVKRYSDQCYGVLSTEGGVPTWGGLSSTSFISTPKRDTTRTKDPPGQSITSNEHQNGDVDALASLAEDTNKTKQSRNHSKVDHIYTELVVYCYFVDFNGAEYGVVREVFVFKPYEFSMNVRHLEAFPLRYLEASPVATTSNSLLERGRMFVNLTRTSHMQYQGLSAGPRREDINSPVIVDVNTAYSLALAGIDSPKFKSPDKFSIRSRGSRREAGEVFDSDTSCSRRWCYSTSCQNDIYDEHQFKLKRNSIEKVLKVLEEYNDGRHRHGHDQNEARETGSNLTAGFVAQLETSGLIYLLPGVVPGFILRSRRWALLELSCLREIPQRNEWKNLVLPRGHQKMVQAMVETYTHGKPVDGIRIGMDLVSGKGDGCIILLHGVPGVGKTSTAECVAAYTNKPLYPITCGDIGTTPEDVESNMTGHFEMAHKWGCVLLLDEADVFLAKRDNRDVVRNGLVSVFLRILEYYSGILFLTTNRVGAIDDAFRSRLHLQLYYPKLTRTQTNKIFRKNFEQIGLINEDRVRRGLPEFGFEMDTKRGRDARELVMTWAERNFETLGWNGRQIRNAFQTVLALAEFDWSKGLEKRMEKQKKKRGKVDGPVIKLRLFKIVAEASLQFNRYLRDTHGLDEYDLAQRDKLRSVEHDRDRDWEGSEIKRRYERRKGGSRTTGRKARESTLGVDDDEFRLVDPTDFDSSEEDEDDEETQSESRSEESSHDDEDSDAEGDNSDSGTSSGEERRRKKGKTKAKDRVGSKRSGKEREREGKKKGRKDELKGGTSSGSKNKDSPGKSGKSGKKSKGQKGRERAKSEGESSGSEVG